MEPTISNNDTLVVHLGRTRPVDGHIYVVRNDDQLWVKRLQVLPSAWLLLKSDNKHYQPMQVPKDEQHTLRSDRAGRPYLPTTWESDMNRPRAAARWRVSNILSRLPYLLYQLGPRRDACQLHLQWDGVVLPVDDPWVGTALPLNSDGCTCGVRQGFKV